MNIFLLLFFFHFNLCNKYLTKPNINNSINKKNIILGVILNYSFENVILFFNSIIHANIKNCDVVMFIQNISKVLEEYLKKIGIILFKIPKKYKIFHLHIWSLRWKLYLDFLTKEKNKYNLVFISDVRDVIFQKDIFQYYKKTKPFFGFSLESKTLNETTNKKWIIDFVGKEIHGVIKNNSIICFGTMWGTIDKILEFINIFWGKLKIGNNSIDQGIGNYLLYYEKILNKFLIKSDHYGPVMTIGFTERKKIFLDSNNNILNYKGEIAPVIHQYDRKKDILEKILKKFLFLDNRRINNCNESNNLFIYKNISKNKNIKQNIQYYPYRENKIHYMNIIHFLIIFQFLVIVLLLKRISYLYLKKYK